MIQTIQSNSIDQLASSIASGELRQVLKSSGHGQAIVNFRGKEYTIFTLTQGRYSATALDSYDSTITLLHRQNKNKLTSLKEFFTHRLFRGTFKSHTTQLEEALTRSARAAARTPQPNTLKISAPQNALHSFFKKISQSLPASLSSTPNMERAAFLSSTTPTIAEDYSPIDGLTIAKLKIFAEDIKILPKSIVSFWTNDGKTYLGNNMSAQTFVNTLISDPHANSAFFSTGNIYLLEEIEYAERATENVLGKEITRIDLDTKATQLVSASGNSPVNIDTNKIRKKINVSVCFKNTYDTNITSPFIIDGNNRPANNGEFRGQRAIDTLKTKDFKSLSDLAQQIGNDDNLNYKKQRMLNAALNLNHQYALTSALVNKLFRDIPALNDLVIFSEADKCLIKK